VRGADDHTTFMCRMSWKCCSLIFLEPSGPHRACNGTALHLPLRKHTSWLLTYLLTYLLTPWSRVLLEKLTGPQLVKKFPAFYGARNFITAFTSALQLPLPWASSIQSILPTSHFLQIHFNIVFPSKPSSSKCSLSLRFPNQNPVYASPLPHTRYMPLPSHSSQFYHQYNIGWRVQIVKLLIL
jgi:hypothetical protein